MDSYYADAIRQTAEVLAKLLTKSQQADLLNILLCGDEKDSLNDEQYEVAEKLFEELMEAVDPEVVQIAQEGEEV